MIRISWIPGARRLVRLASLAIVVATVPVLAADAMQPPHGTLAATIRSAGLPCQHVISVAPAGDDRWSVRCNSGSYVVVRGDDGKLFVP